MSKLKLQALPKDEWEAKLRDSETIIISKWSHRGHRYSKKFLFSDLPNDCVGLDDLKLLSVDVVDGMSI